MQTPIQEPAAMMKGAEESVQHLWAHDIGGIV